MTAGIHEKCGPQSPEAQTDLNAFLQQLTQCGLALAFAPGTPVPPEALRSARRLLSRAYTCQSEGDWPRAIALCLEAEKDPVYSIVARLNVLIGRYHTEHRDGLIQQARELAATLSAASRYACLALMLLVAHRTQQWPTARETALELAARIQSPWDLPSVPGFAVLAQRKICVNERRSTEPILAAIDDLRAMCQFSDAERKSLDSMVERYKQREDKAKQA